MAKDDGCPTTSTRHACWNDKTPNPDACCHGADRRFPPRPRTFQSTDSRRPSQAAAQDAAGGAPCSPSPPQVRPGERPACCSSTASLGSSASNVACRSAVSARRDGKSQRSRSAEGTLHPSPATTRGVARGASWSPSPPRNPAAPEPEGSWHLSGHLDRTHSPAGERAEEKGVLTCSANVSMTAYGVV